MAITQFESSDNARKPPPVQRQGAPRRATLLIGKLARLSGRSVHTIRWYESQRLIPGVRRDSQGRRAYVDAHVEWLQHLERLRDSGMSIRDMREYTALAKRGVSTLAERQQLLRVHHGRVVKRIEDLNAAMQFIEEKIDFYEQWRTTGERPASAPTRAKAHDRVK